MKENPKQYVNYEKEPAKSHYFDDNSFEAIKNADFDFPHKDAKLIPIIFSHGLNSEPGVYTRHILELVSHGYIVFAIWHNGGCCAYTETEDGTSTGFDHTFKFYDYEARHSQVKKRENNVKLLIDEIFQDNYLQEKLNFPAGVTLDKEKLAMNGQSFGGITCIGAAVNDERIKVCIPMDPWFFPHKDSEVTLPSTPTLVICSENWDEWVDKTSLGQFN